MIITKNTRWITSYEIMNEYDVTMTISQYKNGKLARSLTYIIPIEFYDDVRIWDWEVVIGANGINGTPVITSKQYNAIRELTKMKKIEILSLNKITPFAWRCKNGKTMVSDKNNYSYIDNSEKGVVWFNEDELEKAQDCYLTYLEEYVEFE